MSVDKKPNSRGQAREALQEGVLSLSLLAAGIAGVPAIANAQTPSHAKMVASADRYVSPEHPDPNFTGTVGREGGFAWVDNGGSLDLTYGNATRATCLGFDPATNKSYFRMTTSESNSAYSWKKDGNIELVNGPLPENMYKAKYAARNLALYNRAGETTPAIVTPSVNPVREPSNHALASSGDVFTFGPYKIGRLVAGKRTLTFDDGGTERTLVMERPHIKAMGGYEFTPDVWANVVEKQNPATGQFLARDGSNFRFIVVNKAPGGPVTGVTVSPPLRQEQLVGTFAQNGAVYLGDGISASR